MIRHAAEVFTYSQDEACFNSNTACTDDGSGTYVIYAYCKNVVLHSIINNAVNYNDQSCSRTNTSVPLVPAMISRPLPIQLAMHYVSRQPDLGQDFRFETVEMLEASFT